MNDRTVIDNEGLSSKTHPATREMLPDDPLSLTGVEVPGDPDLMLRLLVEEYARMGCDLEVVVSLAQDVFYQAFHGLLLAFGEDEFRRRVAEILNRVGVVRVTAVEKNPSPTQLVQVESLLSTGARPVEEPPCLA